MLEFQKPAKPGHVVVGKYVTASSVDELGVFHELKLLGINNEHQRRAYLKAAVVVEKILREMMA